MPVFIVLLIFVLIPAIALSIAIPLIVVNGKYRKFVSEHSQALKTLVSINKKYNFKKINNFNQVHAYDNENYYDIISPEDYLIYQLVYIKESVVRAIDDVRENEAMLELYKNEIKNECTFGVYDTEVTLKNKQKLDKYEKRLFYRQIKYPTTKFSISVYIELEKINGEHVCGKREIFYPKDILNLIDRIEDNSNGFYHDEEIWKSICRVERGKVTNKLRFAIYARDGHRCRMCGRYFSSGLEIDHIIPIAKGGKSTSDNLQTLCHKCNKKKGTDIIPSKSGYSR